jgi:metal-responsive CopG/Arc/MetJ family transcriptional regulator
MTKSSTNVKPKKKLGRPVEIGADQFIGLRIPGALVKAIDAWAKEQNVKRSDAVRALLERGLAPAAAKSRRPAKRKGAPQ